jgi:DNA-directed RNA polymerase subunit RPC12/RpoP
MINIYTSYSCKVCKREFVLLTEEIESMSKDRYIACPYCNSKHIKKQKIADNLKECMSERSYRRNRHGALEQRRGTI